MTDRIEMSEADLQTTVIGAADLGGWLVFHDHDSRRNRAGFPDLVLLRGNELLFVELKTRKGRLSPDQKLWLEGLADVEVLSSDVIRPDDLDGLIARLLRKGDR